MFITKQKEKEIRELKIKALLSIIEKKFGVTKEDFLNKRKKEPIPTARKYIGYALRKDLVKFKYIQEVVNCTHGNLCSGIKSLLLETEMNKHKQKDLEEFYLDYKKNTTVYGADQEIKKLRSKISEYESQINYLEFIREKFLPE